MPNYYESEACFRRYENYITEACLTYPKEVFFRTEGLSLVTDAARGRDAITSFRTNKWASSIDPVAYASVLMQITVFPFMGYAVILHKTRLQFLRKLWRKEGRNGKYCVAEHVAENVIQARRMYEQELSRALDSVKIATKANQPMSGDIVVEDEITPDEFLMYNIEDAVNAINEGKVNLTYTCKWSEEVEFRVRNAVGEKLNVVYVVDKSKQTINIF